MGKITPKGPEDEEVPKMAPRSQNSRETRGEDGSNSLKYYEVSDKMRDKMCPVTLTDGVVGEDLLP